MILIILGHLRVLQSIHREGGLVGRAKGMGRIDSVTAVEYLSLWSWEPISMTMLINKPVLIRGLVT